MSSITNPAAAGASKPGGVDKQIQFNDSGAFAGDNGLLYDKATGAILIGGSVRVGANPAQQGGVRLANGTGTGIYSRNAANGADLAALLVGGDNKVYVGENTNDSGLVLRSGVSIGITRGIQWPATQVPSTDPYTQDDYREVAFTPSFGGQSGQSGQAYSTQTGLSIKVGRLVFFSLRLSLSTLGTITGNVVINGFPYPFADPGIGGSRYIYGLPVGYFAGLAGAVDAVSLIGAPNATYCLTYYTPAGGAAFQSALTPATLTAAADIVVTGTYHAAN